MRLVICSSFMRIQLLSILKDSMVTGDTMKLWYLKRREAEIWTNERRKDF